ncbi:uncharacterized protein LOC105202931 [Solenopsis invicta]|uniref:uncharacterized protein LOC105202931 n=1 Tax=Solenopsis invicta TaxID=13686 RepID=UPI000595F54E|nr:uncharacterized protein LOC105202931 [Solenopsis invicta]
MSMDFESAVRLQVELRGRMANTAENVRKLGAANITVDVIENCLQFLDKNWERFEARHAELNSKYWNDHEDSDYFCDGYETEEVYLSQRIALTTLRRSLVGNTAGIESRPPTNEPPQLPSYAPQTTLPKITVLHFSGKFEDWPSFRDLFRLIIGNDRHLFDVEKHYLRTCIEREAASFIKPLPIVGENSTRLDLASGVLRK